MNLPNCLRLREVAVGYRTRMFSTVVPPPSPPPPRKGIKFDSIGFSLNYPQETKMVIAKTKWNSIWQENDFKVVPYGKLDLEPAATVLNYGQGIFEGLKAYRTDRGRIVVFRPDRNAKRFANGASRFLMPEIPEDIFVSAVKQAVIANGDLVPSSNLGALYLRPMLFGSGSSLGVAPSPEYTFVIYVSPVGSYFNTKPGAGARMKMQLGQYRAAPGGVGNVKCIGNYAQCFSAQKHAKEAGFSDIIYLEAKDGNKIEEVAASNLFVVTKDSIITPASNSILPGVTRDSVCQIVRHFSESLGNRKMIEDDISIDFLFKSGEVEEVFCSGTAAGVTSIEHIFLDSQRFLDMKPSPGPCTAQLQKLLFGIMAERVENPFSWLHDPFSEV